LFRGGAQWSLCEDCIACNVAATTPMIERRIRVAGSRGIGGASQVDLPMAMAVPALRLGRGNPVNTAVRGGCQTVRGADHGDTFI